MRGSWLVILLAYITIFNGLNFSVGSANVRIEVLATLFCAFVFFLLVFLKKKTIGSLGISKAHFLLFTFCSVMLLSSILYAPDKKYSIIQSLNQVIICCSYLIMAKYTILKRNIQLYLNHCFNATLFITATGIVFFLISFLTGKGLYGINLTQNESEAFGVYMTMREPNLFGSYLMGIFFISLSLYSNRTYESWGISKLKVRLVLLLSVLGILLTFTRGVWLATMVGLIIYYFNSIRGFIKNLPRLFLFTLFTVICFAFLKYVLKIDIISYKLGNFLSTDVGTGEGRLIIWTLALYNWFEKGHWLLGNGTYSFASFFNTDSYSNETNAWIGNMYITLLHDVGIIGLILFMMFIIALLKWPKQPSRKQQISNPANLFRGIRIAIITTLIAFFFTTGLSLSFCWILFGFALGVRTCLISDMSSIYLNANSIDFSQSEKVTSIS